MEQKRKFNKNGIEIVYNNDYLTIKYNHFGDDIFIKMNFHDVYDLMKSSKVDSIDNLSHIDLAYYLKENNII